MSVFTVTRSLNCAVHCQLLKKSSTLLLSNAAFSRPFVANCSYQQNFINNLRQTQRTTASLTSTESKDALEIEKHDPANAKLVHLAKLKEYATPVAKQIINYQKSKECLEAKYPSINTMTALEMKSAILSEGEAFLRNAMLQRLVQMEEYGVATEVFDSLPANKRNWKTKSIMVNVAASTGDIAKAEEYYQMVSESGYLSTHTTNALLKCYTQTKDYADLETGFQKFSLFSENDLKPDVISFTTLMRGCINHLDFNRALIVYADMRSAGFKPDSTTYAVFLSGCSVAREAEKALVLYEDLIEDNIEITPAMYARLLNALGGRVNFQEKALQIMVDIHEKGIAVDEHIARGFLRNCARDGNVQAAHMCFNSMDCRPQTTHFNLLISTYQKQTSFLVEARDDARLSGVQTALTLEDLAKVILSESQSDEVVSFYSQKASFDWTVTELLDISLRRVAQMESLDLQPDITTFNNVLGICAAALQYNTAMELFETLPKRLNVEVNLQSYHILLKLSARLEQGAQVLKLFRELKTNLPEFYKERNAQALYVDVLYTSLHNGAYLYAEQLCREMCEYNLIPAPHVFYKVRSDLLENGYEKEWDVIKQMMIEHDLTGRWFTKEEQNIDTIRKWKPKKQHRFLRKPWQKKYKQIFNM